MCIGPHPQGLGEGKDEKEKDGKRKGGEGKGRMGRNGH